MMLLDQLKKIENCVLVESLKDFEDLDEIVLFRT